MKRQTMTFAAALALMLLSIAFIPTAGHADTAVSSGPSLARIGGMGGGGGHMMGGEGYGPGGWGRMGNGRGWFSGGDSYRDGYGYGNSYRRGGREELRQELRRERQALSDMVRGGNADPDQVDRQMNRIEDLEHRLDGFR